MQGLKEKKRNEICFSCFFIFRKTSEASLFYAHGRTYEYYEGKTIIIVKKHEITTEFLCSFDKIHLYPYGRQRCFFEVGVVELANNDSGVLMINNTNSLKRLPFYEIGQYNVEDWEIETNEKNMVVVSFFLERNLGRIFTVTYLPTSLMNILNQAVVYIKMENKHDLIITGLKDCFV